MKTTYFILLCLLTATLSSEAQSPQKQLSPKKESEPPIGKDAVVPKTRVDTTKVNTIKAETEKTKAETEKTKAETEKTKAETEKNKIGVNNDNYGWNDRISFILGGGPSLIATSLYNDPVVDKTTNIVIIEKANILKPNLTFGIVYTPFVSNVIRYIKVKSEDGKTIEDKSLIEYYPRGITYALFINPVNLSSLADKSLSTSVDLGLGAGYRAGSFSILGTIEFFSVRQPRDYFVEQYKDTKLKYIVNNQTQTSFDVNDNSIFESKIAVAFGVKLCYTFDIVKSFYKTSNDINK